MCFDILEQEEIITYRKKEHDLLMDIRNGRYLDSDKQPTSDFFELVDELEKRFTYAKNNTSLPEQPDYQAINQLIIDINEYVVCGMC